MAIGYTYQDSFVIFGNKSGTTRNSSALTSNYNVNSATFDTGGMSKVNLNILYKTGVAETNNSIEIRVESSPDGTNWYQIPNESVSGGTSTLTQREFTFVGADSATTYQFSLPLDVQDEYMKIAVKETGVVVYSSSAYIEATLSGAK